MAGSTIFLAIPLDNSKTKCYTVYLKIDTILGTHRPKVDNTWYEIKPELKV
jgi:hypothetical protein